MTSIPIARTPELVRQAQLRFGAATAARSARPPSRLVVVEAGAAMTGLSIAFKRDSLPLKPATNESPGDFVARVLSCARLLEQSGARLTRVLLAVAAHPDAQTSLARHTLARELLASLSAADDGELLFWVTAVDADVRHELLASIEKLLTEEPVPRGASVRVRFVGCLLPGPRAREGDGSRAGSRAETEA